MGVAEGSTINGFTDVTWDYLVTNTGNEPLEALLVTDDQGVAVTCPATTLAVGASITCTGTGNIGNGASYENIGFVEAVGAITGDPSVFNDDASFNAAREQARTAYQAAIGRSYLTKVFGESGAGPKGRSLVAKSRQPVLEMLEAYLLAQ